MEGLPEVNQTLASEKSQKTSAYEKSFFWNVSPFTHVPPNACFSAIATFYSNLHEPSSTHASRTIADE